MKSIGSLLLALCVLVGLCTTDSFSQGVEMPVEAEPQVTEIVGETEATFPATIYPKFLSSTSNNAECDSYLMGEFTVSGDLAEDACTESCVAEGGLSGAPLWYASSMGDGSVGISANPGWQTLEGLSTTLEIPEEYRGNSTLLITWTAQIDGVAPDIAFPQDPGYSINPELCGDWVGEASQEFAEAPAMTRLTIGGEAKETAELTIPTSGTVTVSETGSDDPDPPPSDPTVTGSFSLSAADFEGGQFPETLDIAIEWYNYTSMKLVSPAGQRNMILTLEPITEDPEDPVDPEDPEDPVDPEDPEDPVDPEFPGE